jgi:putative ABC transport system permease protein
MEGALNIPIWRLSLAYALFLIVILVAWGKRLRLTKTLAVSISRMTIQLILMGLILKTLFELDSWIMITGIFLVMIFFAAQTIIKRSGVRFRGVYLLLFISILMGGGTIFIYFILFVIHNDPWYAPRYFIPLAGMIIGNSMNGSALALERFYDLIRTHRGEIETLVSFGATADEAARDYFKKAYRASLLPVLTNMTGIGIVFIPGMMTGQILGGTTPVLAIKYQMAIMAAILGSVAITGFFILSLSSRIFFDTNHLPKVSVFETPTPA